MKQDFETELEKDEITTSSESEIEVFRPDDSPESLKRDIKNFLLINILMVALVTVFMYIVKSQGNQLALGGFAVIMMFIPAYAVIHVKEKSNKEPISPGVKKFYGAYKFTTIAGFIIIPFMALVGSIFGSSIFELLVLVICIYGFVLMKKHKDEFERLNMRLLKNGKTMFLLLLYLVITKVSFLIIDSLSNGQGILSSVHLKTLGVSALILLTNIAFGWLLFFGEEFGWRGFLQPRMQRIYGNRLGIILVGVIWGVWHLPLCLWYYAPASPIECLVNQIGFCVALGIFIGYAYMKTENMWVPILIHLANNSLGMAARASAGEIIFDYKAVLAGFVVNFILYGLFILTKTFRNNRSEVSIDI